MKITKAQYKRASKVIQESEKPITGLQLLLAGVSALGASMFVYESKAAFIFPTSIMLGVSFTCILVVLIEYIDFIMSKLGAKMIFEKLVLIALLFVMPIWSINKAVSVYSTLHGANYVAEGQITPPEATNKQDVYNDIKAQKKSLNKSLDVAEQKASNLQDQITILVNDNRSYYWSSYSKKLVMKKVKTEEVKRLNKALANASELLKERQTQIGKQISSLDAEKVERIELLKALDAGNIKTFEGTKQKAKKGNLLLVIFVELGKVACTLLMLIATVFKDQNESISKEELLEKVRFTTLKYGNDYGAKTKILKELGMSATRTKELRNLQIEAGVLDPITNEYLS